MSASNFKVGQSVQITNRNINGRIAYVGLTSFSPGNWIGVVLDEKGNGKNNGTVNGVTYFKCAPNCGLFVRPYHLTLLTDAVSPEHCISDTSTAMDTAASVEASADSKQSNEKPTQCTPSGADADRSRDAPATTLPKSLIPIGNLSTIANILKTTIINQPKQAKERIFYSNSQLELRRNRKPISLKTSAEAMASSNPDLVTAPKCIRTNTSPLPSTCGSVERSKFIETGFLEILQTKFTPGFPMRSSTTFNMNIAQARRSTVEQNERYKDLEAKIENLETELEGLKCQKMVDQEVLCELEKYKLQNEKLLECKCQIMAQQDALEGDLQRLRQELCEAIQGKSKYKRELDDIADSIEMLTLDKEMAQERAEMLQIELELAQERIEELTIDLEILRTENENCLSILNKNDYPHKEDTSSMSTEMKMLEQYNQRLKEAIMHLRDVLMQEKQSNQSAAKELETKAAEIVELKKTKEILSKKLDVMERHVVDLSDQVDATLGAEVMITKLANAKLVLEDRVKLLEEEVVELEALEEIHEQIIESNQELEMDLREEIEELNAMVRALQREKDNALETVYDRDITIIKFRNLMSALNVQPSANDPSPAATDTTTYTSNEWSSSLNQELMHGIDFNHIFCVTKAGGRALEMQLNALELNICKAYIENLLAFVPEDFLLRGKEHDVILVLLLLERIYEKVGIISQAIGEKFPTSCVISKNVIFEGFAVHRFAFRCKCLYALKSLKLITKQFAFGLSHCEYEICTHAAIYRAEMETQEKHIDELLDLLKIDMIDENTIIDPLEHVSIFFNRLYINLIGTQNAAELIDEHHMNAVLMEILDVGLDCINTNATLLHTIIKLGDENTESFNAMQYLIENTNTLKQKLKKLHRKFPTVKIIFDNAQQLLCEQMHEVLVMNEHFGRIINILIATVKDAKKYISSNTESCSADVAIDHERLWKFIVTNYTKLCAEEKQTPIGMFQKCIHLVDAQINSIYSFITDSASIRNTNHNTVFVRSSATTLLQRSNEVKRQLDDLKSLKHILVERDKEIKAQKYIAKLKQEQFAEVQIRKDIVERNFIKMQREQEQIVTTVMSLVDCLEKTLFCKEVTITQALTVFQEKLANLERVFVKMEQAFLTRKVVINLTADESSRQIEALSQCLRRERTEHMKLQMNELRARLYNFEPLVVPHKVELNVADMKLAKELQALKHQWILSHITLKADTKMTRFNIKRNSDICFQRIFNTYYKSHPHRLLLSNYGKFGSKEMNEQFQKLNTSI